MSTDSHAHSESEQKEKTKIKVSKWGIASLVYFILNIIGLPTTSPSWTSVSDFGIQFFTVVVELVILWYIVRYIKKSGLRGLKIATLSLYGVAIINAYFLLTSLYLIGPAKQIEEFATITTKNIVKKDFVELKKVSTKDLASQLTYTDDLKDFTDAIDAAGVISECSFIESSYTKSTLGFYRVFKGFNWGLQGEYSVRCFGATGYIDFTNSLRKVGGKWLINNLVYISSDPEIQKRAAGEDKK